MLQASVIMWAWSASVLLTAVSYAWRVGAPVNREVLLTLSLMLGVVLMLQGL